MLLNKDFKEFIALLNKNNVDYLIVGGYALAFHGHPRYTKDLDVWILLDKGNIEKLLLSLNQFGFESLALSEEDFSAGNVIQLGYAPNRIDILTSASGVSFQQCYSHSVEIELEGVKVRFIDRDDLIKNKQASGRLQDLADIEKLKG